MADGVDISYNDRDLAAALKEFRTDVSVKIVRASLRAIARDEMRALQQSAPVGDPSKDPHSGRLKANITYGTAFAIGRGIVKSFVRIRTRGKADDAKNAFYWRFVEFGHRDRGGGSVPGKGFIQRAIALAQSSIANRFFSDLSHGIDKTYTKQGKIV